MGGDDDGHGKPSSKGKQFKVRGPFSPVCVEGDWIWTTCGTQGTCVRSRPSSSPRQEDLLARAREARKREARAQDVRKEEWQTHTKSTNLLGVLGSTSFGLAQAGQMSSSVMTEISSQRDRAVARVQQMSSTAAPSQLTAMAQVGWMSCCPHLASNGPPPQTPTPPSLTRACAGEPGGDAVGNGRGCESVGRWERAQDHFSTKEREKPELALDEHKQRLRNLAKFTLLALVIYISFSGLFSLYHDVSMQHPL
jgi:hypothetical protein